MIRAKKLQFRVCYGPECVFAPLNCIPPPVKKENCEILSLGRVWAIEVHIKGGASFPLNLQQKPPCTCSQQKIEGRFTHST